jgi:hypothetical protein
VKKDTDRIGAGYGMRSRSVHRDHLPAETDETIGSLLEPLVIPPDTIAEPPITSGARPNDALFATNSYAEGDNDEECPELFLHVSRLHLLHTSADIQRIGGIDVSPSVLPFAIETTKPPSPNEASSSSRPYVRWEPLESEIWLGGLEKYNPRLEGYEAIVALEVCVDC